MDRLYIVIRADLKPGLQMAQACHVAMSFAEKFGSAPENVVVLHVPTEFELVELHGRAYDRGLPVVLFEEPDLDYQATAIAISGEAKKLVSNLPLALRPDPKFDEICVPRDV